MAKQKAAADGKTDLAHDVEWLGDRLVRFCGVLAADTAEVVKKLKDGQRTEIMTAARNGDYGRVRELLEEK